MDVPGYQIGGVFLLMALFMYGTSVSGFFPKLSGHGKTVGIVMAVVALAALAVHYAPEWMEQARTAWMETPGAPEAKSAPAPAAKPSPKPRARSVKAEVAVPAEAPVPEAKMMVVPQDLPQPKPVSETAVGGAGNRDAYDSKLKHAAKSVGRFLHVVPKHNP